MAQLARLTLSEGEAAVLQKDISSILDYVGQVASVSAEGAEASTQNRNSMRADMPREGGDPMAEKREALLTALPRREGEYNVVRKIIQKDE